MRASAAHAGQEVLVGLDGVGDVGVPEPLGHHLHGDAFLDEQAPVRVAESWNLISGTPALATIRLKVW
ncbi:MAG: hypothetical protein M5U14_21215 [Acidimicrobiia bacterium]|nr:hypothetical protein [Acidimicrobiia bacterium]